MRAARELPAGRRSFLRSLTALLAAAVLAAIALSVAGCSSAPKAPDGVFVRRNEAARLSELGASALQEGTWAEAWRLYAEAYRISTAVDDAQGRFVALEGAYRAAEADPGAPLKSAETGKGWGSPPRNAEAARTLAVSVGRSGAEPELRSRASRLEAEGLLAAGDYAAAAALAAEAASGLSRSPAEKTAALRVRARALKSSGDAAAALDALAEAASLDKAGKRFADYAADRYLAASILSKSSDYQRARMALTEALDADRRAENPAGIGSDLLALGLVAERVGEPETAAGYYAAARDVFAAARLSVAADDAEARRLSAVAAFGGGSPSGAETGFEPSDWSGAGSSAPPGASAEAE